MEEEKVSKEGKKLPDDMDFFGDEEAEREASKEGNIPTTETKEESTDDSNKEDSEEKEFDEVSKARKQGALFSFYKKEIYCSPYRLFSISISAINKEASIIMFFTFFPLVISKE